MLHVSGLPREIRQQEKISPGFQVSGSRFQVALIGAFVPLYY